MPGARASTDGTSPPIKNTMQDHWSKEAYLRFHGLPKKPHQKINANPVLETRILLRRSSLHLIQIIIDAADKANANALYRPLHCYVVLLQRCSKEGEMGQQAHSTGNGPRRGKRWRLLSVLGSLPDYPVNCHHAVPFWVAAGALIDLRVPRVTVV